MSRFRRAAWNYGATLLYMVVTLVVGLVATPYLVGWLDRDRYGAARTATDLYGFLGLLELGLTGTIAPLVAGALGRGDARAMRGTMAAGVRAYLLLTVPILAVGLAMGLAIDRLIPVPSAYRPDLHRAWLVGLVGWMALCLTPMRALAEASQRGYLVQLLMTAQSLAVTALLLALARAGWGITGQLLAPAAGSVGLALALTWSAHRSHPGLLRAIRSSRPDPESRAAVWALSRPTLAFNVSSRFALLSDNVVVSAVLGTEMVTSLVLTARLATLAQAQLQAIGGASWAALAEMHARGERELFNRRLVELTGLVALLGAAILGPIVAFNGRFMALWLGRQDSDAGLAVAAVAAANAFLFGVFSLWSWCFAGTGKVGRIVGPIAASSAFNLGVSVLLTRWLGVIGPILGTLITFLTFYVAVLPARLRRDFGTPTGPLLRAAAAPLAWGLPYAAALLLLARAHDPSAWFAAGGDRARRLLGLAVVAAEMGAAALLYLAVAGRFLLSPTDRQVWRRRLAALRPGAAPQELEEPLVSP